MSLVVLADQEATKVLPVELLKSYTQTRKHAVTKQETIEALAFAAPYWQLLESSRSNTAMQAESRLGLTCLSSNAGPSSQPRPLFLPAGDR